MLQGVILILFCTCSVYANGVLLKGWMIMVIIETSIFTNIIQGLLSDEEYASFQEVLVCDPKCGSVIKGSGGLRKIRWKIAGKGKRGGARVVYYYLDQEDQIYMLYAYQKNKQGDLTNQQVKQLKAMVMQEINT